MVAFAGGLAGVVRPFVKPDVQPAPSPQAGASGTSGTNTKLVIGRGSAKTFTGTFDLTISYYKVRKPKEKQR